MPVVSDMSQEPSDYWSISSAELITMLDSSPTGLTNDEAEKRLLQYGMNTVKTKKRTDSAALLLRQFRNPLVLILLAASVLAFLTSDELDGLIIASIVVLSSLLGFWQEKSAANAVEKLLLMVQVRVTVLRDGQKLDIPLDHVVPGDVVLLSAGDLVPGDCSIIDSKDLYVNEATLTGEAYPAEKNAGIVRSDAPMNRRPNTLYMGTNVASGSAQALVVRTGFTTEFGKISERLALRQPTTEFEKGVNRFGYMLSQLTLLFVLTIFALNVYFQRPVIDSFLFALALAVGITPELLPAIISISLSHGAKSMADAHVIVKQLAVIQNLGSMDVLCTDKTGTITEGVMRVHSTVDAEGNESEKTLLYAYLNAFYQTGYRNPIDEAIVKHRTLDVQGYRKLDEYPYDFTRKRLSLLISDGRTNVVIMKGAVRNVLETCTNAEVVGGKSVGISVLKDQIMKSFSELSTQGFRTLAVAYKEAPDCTVVSKESETMMTFLGFVVLSDPLKEGIRETVEELNLLGVDVRIISGDNRGVAAAIGHQAGLPVEDILTGADIRTMTSEELALRAREVRVFADVEPNQKERIILALRKAGRVVGYMGDGVNDASALHAADVGISVDTAVDVAKEAAQIVLLEKDLGVLARGVRLGRRTFANTMKYVFITMSANFGNMLSMAGISLILPYLGYAFLPLLPKQILALNFMTDIPAAAISTDNVDKNTVERPRRWNIRFIGQFMVAFGVQSTVFDFITFGVLLLALHATELEFQTGWFMLSMVTEILILMVIRTQSLFTRSLPSRGLLSASLVVLAATLLLPFTPLAEALSLTILPLGTTIGLALIVGAYVVTAEITKYIFYRLVDPSS